MIEVVCSYSFSLREGNAVIMGANYFIILIISIKGTLGQAVLRIRRPNQFFNFYWVIECDAKRIPLLVTQSKKIDPDHATTIFRKIDPDVLPILQYGLNRWKNMHPYLSNGALGIDNNLVENIIRPAAIGLKNYLFAGSHDSAKRIAMIYTFFAACKHHNINPEEWLNDVLYRIQAHPINQINQLFPQYWKNRAR